MSGPHHDFDFIVIGSGFGGSGCPMAGSAAETDWRDRTR